MSVVVLRPGPLSTIQDLGRAGYQRFGVIASGVMDEWSHRVANLLVGNPESAATLEMTLIGANLRFERTTLIALCGADFSARIAGHAVPIGCPVLVRAGGSVEFGTRASGCRAYLAVHGGFDVAPVMGSRSTYLRAGFGGFEGRALRKGDVLPVGEGDAEALHPELTHALGASAAFAVPSPVRFAPVAHPAQAPEPVRVVAGQQWHRFSERMRTRFLDTEFRVGLNSDRMGYRLEGETLALDAPLEMISEGVAFGTVQVPPDGNPIILMADRQTAGGYPKIAAVVAVDLPRLAQMLPKQALRFRMIGLDAAQRLYLEREREIGGIGREIEGLQAPGEG